MAPEKNESTGPFRSADTLKANVEALMKAHAELNSNPTLGKKTGLGSSAIHRIRQGHNATLATIDRLAEAFGIEPWHLLMVGLDPANLPALKPLTEQEKKLYQRLLEVAKEIAP